MAPLGDDTHDARPLSDEEVEAVRSRRTLREMEAEEDGTTTSPRDLEERSLREALQDPLT